MHSFQSIHGDTNPNSGERVSDNVNPSFLTGMEPKGQAQQKRDVEPDQRAMDLIDEACMESFPCSDPPSYTRCHC